jgi:dephospho-CoA kinase
MLESGKINKVAVTGGLSCGKSTVSRFFKELGAYVVSADEIVHQQLSPDTNLGQKVIHLIGPEIVINHQIDRSQIAKKVFDNTQLLQSLEGLLHPVVFDEMERLYQQVCHDHLAPLFIAEIPLLFETGGERFFDFTVAVIADPCICQRRFQAVTGNGKEEYEKRMAHQWNIFRKARCADYLVFNNGKLSDMQHAVKDLFYRLTNKQ